MPERTRLGPAALLPPTTSFHQPRPVKATLREQQGKVSLARGTAAADDLVSPAKICGKTLSEQQGKVRLIMNRGHSF